MAHIPEKVLKSEDFKRERIEDSGAKGKGIGKVRDSYQLDSGRLLVHASNRISIFDFVLNAIVPGKGEVLTAMTHFWLTQVLKNLPNHLINDKNGFNDSVKLTDHFSRLPVESLLVVKDLSGDLDPYELIFRKHLGGSVWKSYEKTRIVSGQQMPEGLKKWQALDKAIFTPSTKELIGHDINIDAVSYLDKWGVVERNL